MVSKQVIRIRLYGLTLLTFADIRNSKILVVNCGIRAMLVGMYGKHFASMYCGSMVGAGFGVYSLMGYVIANMKPDKVVGFQVELNVKLLAVTFGETEEATQKAIDYLCAPDPDTRTEGEEGRRLVKVGKFAYRVVNGVHYNEMRNEEHRREQNRTAQANFRAKKKRPSRAMKNRSLDPSLPGEDAFVKAYENGASQEALDAITTRNLPT